MVSIRGISGIKNVILAGIGAGVSIFALYFGISNAYTMTTVISFYTYYGIHVYSTNKLSDVTDSKP